ncbi:MAG: zf-HC2 domain-containing protein [Planctomycetota bacterium]
MSTCQDIRELLGPCLDGELPAEQRRTLREHVRACPACAREWYRLRGLARALAAAPEGDPPAALWADIERRLAGGPLRRRSPAWLAPRRLTGIAALLLLAVGLGVVALPWFGNSVHTAEAACVDFDALLRGINLDPQRALRTFVGSYGGELIDAAEARGHAPELTFALPAELPGGFARAAVYAIRFGGRPGLAAQYARGAEVLIALFHPPVLQEEYGTHRDLPCIIGPHRGHMTVAGEWRLVHLTDPTTCHCVLSRLDPDQELPSVMAALAPGVMPRERDESPGQPH